MLEAAVRLSHHQRFVQWVVLGSARCRAGRRGRGSFCSCELLTALEQLFKCFSPRAETTKPSPACIAFPFCPWGSPSLVGIPCPPEQVQAEPRAAACSWGGQQAPDIFSEDGIKESVLFAAGCVSVFPIAVVL